MSMGAHGINPRMMSQMAGMRFPGPRAPLPPGNLRFPGPGQGYFMWTNGAKAQVELRITKKTQIPWCMETLGKSSVTVCLRNIYHRERKNNYCTKKYSVTIGESETVDRLKNVTRVNNTLVAFSQLKDMIYPPVKKSFIYTQCIFL